MYTLNVSIHNVTYGACLKNTLKNRKTFLCANLKYATWAAYFSHRIISFHSHTPPPRPTCNNKLISECQFIRLFGNSGVVVD